MRIKQRLATCLLLSVFFSSCNRANQLDEIDSDGDGILFCGIKVPKDTKYLVFSREDFTLAKRLVVPLTEEHTVVACESKDVTNLAPLQKMKKLTFLSLAGTKIKNISIVAELTGLKGLSLNGLPVKDITPIKKLKDLLYLGLNYANAADYSSLSELPRIQNISLSNSSIKSIQPIAHLTSLLFLDLSNTSVKDLLPLSKLTKLMSLNISGTEVASIEKVENFANLRSIYLDKTKVTDLSPLTKLKKLENVTLYDTSVSDNQIKMLKESNPNVYISGPVSIPDI